MAMKIATNLKPPGKRTGHAPVGVERTLTDGSKIAVIGAGPAGSMFSYFLLNIAETIGLDLHVDALDGLHAAEVLGQPAELEDGGHG